MRIEKTKVIGYIIRVSAVEELGLTLPKNKEKTASNFCNMSSIFILEEIGIVLIL